MRLRLLVSAVFVAVFLALFIAVFGVYRLSAPSTTALAHTASTPLAATYPLRAEQVHAMAERGNPAEIRAHAWAILKAMTSDQPGKLGRNSPYPARWDKDDWDNKCSLGLAASDLCASYGMKYESACPESVKASKTSPLESAVQTMPVDPTTANVAAMPITSVRYNEQAARFIRSHCLQDPARLKRLIAGTDEFDSRAAVVKLIWALPDASGRLYVWQNSMADTPHQDAVGLGAPGPGNAWTSILKVNSDTGVPCAAKSYPVTSTTDSSGPSQAVPINCFYHRQFPCAGVKPQQAAEFFGSRVCQVGTMVDVILIGVHVITAEQPTWVWSTFWWTPNPDQDKTFHGDAPGWVEKRGPWRFYSMNTVIGKPLLDADGSVKNVAFNPYLEGPKLHANTSNCMYCHQMAVIRSVPPPASPSTLQESRVGMPPACAYAATLTDTCTQKMQAQQSTSADWFKQSGGWLLANDARYFADTTSNHFLWSWANSEDDAARTAMRMVEAKKRSARPAD